MTNNMEQNTIEISIQVYIVKEGDYFVSYCPSLELSSFGDSPEEAKAGFEEALAIFIGDVNQKGTLENVLLDLGWSLTKRPALDYRPPVNKKSASVSLSHIYSTFFENLPVSA